MKKNNKIIIIVLIIFGVLIVGLSGYFIISHFQKEQNLNIEKNALEKIQPLLNDDSAKATELIKKNIVKVTNKIDNYEVIGTGFFHHEGYLVTNSHVVDRKGNITVEYYDGTKTEAKFIGNDILSDVALLMVEEPKILAMSFASTLDVNITDELYAIGYPYGIAGEASVVKGILSARRSTAGVEFLQVDMSLNSGFSGGPLIDEKGNLLGMNSYATENATIGMAISSDNLEIIIEKLIKEKNVNYIEKERPQNILGTILKEIGFEDKDLYDEKEYSNNKKEDKEENNNNNENNNTQNKPQTKPQLSGDNTLASIKISGYDFQFNKGALQHWITLKNKETSLNLTVVPSHKKATYTITGNSNFVAGVNQVNIKVRAENGATQTYIIYAIVPFTKIEGVVGIITGLDLRKDSNGVNSFVLFWDYKDSDGIRVGQTSYLDVYESLKVEVYKGWSESDKSIDSNGKPIVLLKTYEFFPSGGTNQSMVYIPISDIRALLKEEDYEGGSYQGADLTFKLFVNTREQGTFMSRNPWGLSK